MKKIVLFLLVGMFFLSFASALEFDNSVSYERNDLKATFKNFFGLGTTIGSADLRSHNSVSEIKTVWAGKNKTVMWYDFDFKQLYLGGIGNITFIDLSTDEEIDKDYQIVEWVIETKQRNKYIETGCQFTGNGTKFGCSRQVSGQENYQEGYWKPYTSRNIRGGKTRLGLQVDVISGERIDAVWEIVGKKVARHASWSGSGAGTTLDPFQITSWALLNETRENLTASYILMNDLDQDSIGWATFNTGTGWIPISGSFGGVLDGNRKVISDFKANDSSTGGLALFATINSVSALIKDLGMENVSVDCDRLCAPLVSNFISGNINNSYAHGGRVRSYSGANSEVGGLVGGGSGNITDSYSTNMTITVGTNRGGGLVGEDTGGTISNSYSNNFVSSGASVGGLTGVGSSTNDNSFWDNQTSGQTTSGTGTPKTTLEMKTESTFTDAGWDFPNTWILLPSENEGYPILSNFLLGPGDPPFIFSPSNGSSHATGVNISFNVSAFATNFSSDLVNLTLFIDNVENQTKSITGTSNNTLIIQAIAPFGVKDIFFISCDNNSICLQSLNITLTISDGVYEQSNFSLTTVESTSETFDINFNTQLDISDVFLWYDNVRSPASSTPITSTNFSLTATKSIPQVSTTVDKQFLWQTKLLGGGETNSSLFNQTVQPISFFNCTFGNVSNFLHIDFKDEVNLSSLTASVSLSTWAIWVDDFSLARNFAFTSLVQNATYNFCVTPSDQTLLFDIVFPYLATNYPQRVFTANDIILTNTTTNQTLYLLDSSTGFFTSYLAVNSLTGEALSGVDVRVQKSISGTPTTVAQGLTDDTGLITLWLNPDDSHDFTFTLTGFKVTVFNIRPSSPDTYQINMIPSTATDVSNGTQVVVDLTYEIGPTNFSLVQENTQLFTFNYTKVGVTSVNMVVLDEDLNVISNQTSTLSSDLLSTNIALQNNQSLTAVYTIKTTNETLQLFKIWSILNQTEGNYSLSAWLTYSTELDLDGNSTWWGIFKIILILGILISIATAFYHVDPFDSAIGSLVASIVVVWVFGLFGWLIINTPGPDAIDRSIIPSLYTIVVTSLILWRFNSQ